jgi:hypothetical protein
MSRKERKESTKVPKKVPSGGCKRDGVSEKHRKFDCEVDELKRFRDETREVVTECKPIGESKDGGLSEPEA